VRWYIPVITALGKLRPEDPEFKARPSYIVRTCLKKKIRKEKDNRTIGSSTFWVWPMLPSGVVLLALLSLVFCMSGKVKTKGTSGPLSVPALFGTVSVMSVSCSLHFIAAGVIWLVSL
jgi:hypothetical protein